MKPYYHDEKYGITIYHGDCRDILTHLEPVDLVLTDPPYPGLKGNLEVTFTSGVAASRNTNKTVGDPWKASTDWLPVAWQVVKDGALVFTSWHGVAALKTKDSFALITWFQRNAMPAMLNVPQYKTEFIWAYKKSNRLNWRALQTFYDIPRLQSGCFAKERLVNGSGCVLHPTQKPLKLISELLAVGGETILDPFMGSGTTLVAAKELGRKAIGIEIEEKYCEIAVRRLQQDVFQWEG